MDPDIPRPVTACAVLPSSTRGGAELWLERVAGPSTRTELDVVALADGPAARAWRERGRPVTVIRAGRRTRGAARVVAGLTRHLRQTRPDVVVGQGVKAGLLAAVAGHLSGTRVAWVRHDDSYGGPLVALLDRLSDGRASGAARLAEGRDSVVIDPPLPLPVLDRGAACADLGLPDDAGRLRLVMPTRLVPYKGVDDAIRALADAPRWELHVYAIPDAAHPGEADRLRGLARDLRVDDRVHLHAPDDRVGTRLAAFDAVAVLTRAEPGSPVTAEALGLTAYEGMAAGVPVVAVPPVADAVGPAGVVAGPGDPDSVAEALHRLEDPETRDAAGAEGRRRWGPGGSRPSPTDQLDTLLAGTARRPGAGVRTELPLTVLTTVLDEAEGLDELLRTLRPQLLPDDELVVVDGGSSDGTLEVARRHRADDERVVVLEVPGAGISQGRNAGFEVATHDVVACTDVGCEPVPGWLGALRAAAAAHPDAALLTGVYTVRHRTPMETALAVVGYPSVQELTHPTPLTRVYGRLFGRRFEADMPTGRSVAVRRDAWRAVGGFPEHLATGEDVTFGRAVARTGPALLVSDASVEWEQRPTLRATLRMYYRYGQGSGHSRDPRLLARDGVRVLGYLGGAIGALRGGPGVRAAVVAGGVAYLSVPVLRAAGDPRHPARAVLLVPVVCALRDLTKAAGAVAGLFEGPGR